MKKQETSQLLAVIKTVFPNFEITEQVVRVWHQFLEDVPFDRAQKNLHKHVKTSKFPPTISEIIKNNESWMNGDMLTVEETMAMLAEQEEQRKLAVPMPKWLEEKFAKQKALPRGDGS